MEHPADVDRLYRELQPQLLRILRSNLQLSDWILEDACQTAWSALLARPDGVAAGCELGWLSTTATRIALNTIRRERKLAVEAEAAEVARLEDWRASQPGPDSGLELLERLAEVRRLPERQGRMVMLHGLGYGYEEIAAATGTTCRTVARQLTRARQRLVGAAESA